MTKSEADRRVEYLKTVPKLYRPVVVRAFNGNRPAAVKAKCLDCCHFDRAEVEHCTVVLCPLHPIRPYQASKHAQQTIRRVAGGHAGNEHVG